MSGSDKISDHGFEVFCGLDVGKSAHHACALDRSGKRLHDKPLPNEQAALIDVFQRLTAHGRVLVIVDQPASIGALAVAVARSLGIEVAYLPGLAMRRIADLHPGQGKTDARDAYVIADAARTMPHTLRRVGTDDETLAELTVLAGYDDDLAAQATRLTNRLRDALLHVHPALERLLGPRMDRGGVLDLLAAAPTPDALRQLGEDGITAAMRPRSPRLARPCPARSSPRSTPRPSSSPAPLRLLRPQTGPGQAAQRRPDLSRPPPHRRHLRHAPRPHALCASSPDRAAPGACRRLTTP